MTPLNPTLPTKHIGGAELLKLWGSSHPILRAFPKMTDEELDGLTKDIRENSQQEPAVIWNGQLIDGRNRLLACGRLRIDLACVELPIDTDPVKWVLSRNLHRRHLNASQKAMVGVSVKELLRPAAKERQHGGVPVILPEGQKGDARDIAAKAVGVSGKLIDQASKVIKNGTPELVSAVDAGDVSVSRAAKIADLPVDQQNAAIDEPRKPRDAKKPKDDVREFVRGCDDKITIARVLFEEVTEAQRAQIEQLWGTWLETYEGDGGAA